VTIKILTKKQPQTSFNRPDGQQNGEEEGESRQRQFEMTAMAMNHSCPEEPSHPRRELAPNQG